MLDKELDRINEAADKKAEEIERNNYDKYYDIYKVAINFFRRAPVLMYGGLALNDIMPRDYKFYPKYTLPDIDVFCINGEQVAKKLIREYERRGYKIPAYKEALHPGTWKVFAEGLQVADISSVPANIYTILMKHSRNGSLGIRIVNRQYLRMSLHIMLSQPYDAHRWTKVFQRLLSFYTIFPPPDITRYIYKKDPVTANYNNRIYQDFLKDSEYIIFGLDKLGAYLDEKESYDYSIKIICNESPREVALKLVSTVFTEDNPPRIKTIPGNMLVTEHAIIYDKYRTIAEIYKADMCLSYIKYGKYRYASLHTFLRMYLSISMSNYAHHIKDAKIYTSAINQMTFLQIEQSLEPSRRRLLNQFPIDCYGTQAGLVTLRRNQIERIVK